MLQNKAYRFLSVALSVLICAVSLFPLLQTGAVAPTWEQGFEGSFSAASPFEVYAKSGDTDPLVHSGSKSLKYTPADGTKGFSFYESGFADLEIGKSYNVSLWVYTVATGSQKSCFRVHLMADRNNFWSAYKGVNNGPEYAFDSSKNGQWTEIKTTVTPLKEGDGWFKYIGLALYGNATLYFDDLTVTPVQDPVEITFNTNGGSAVNKLQGVPGTALDLSTVATTKAGHYLAGWYTDEALTSPFTATVFPDSSITLYAKSNANGEAYQDFEGFTNTWTEGNSGGISAEVYDKTATGNSADNVHDGNKSLKVSVTSGGTYLISLAGTNGSMDERLALKKGQGYEVTLWLKMAELTSNGGARIYPSLNNNLWAYRDAGFDLGYALRNAGGFKVGEWKQLTCSFVAGEAGYLALQLEIVGTMYIDGISVKEAPLRTVTVDTQGGTAIAALTGPANSTMTVPVPEKAGYYFAGWYAEAACTTPADTAKFPVTDTTIYAKWILEEHFYQDFENYPFTSALPGGYSIVSENAAQGSKALYVDGTVTGLKPILLCDQYTKLTVGKAYCFSVKIKANALTDITTMSQPCFVQYNDFSNPWSYKSNTSKQLTTISQYYHGFGSYKEFKVYFVAECSYFGITNWGNCAFYVDDIQVTEVPLVTVSFETPGVTNPASKTGAAGDTLKVENPTPPEGKAFAGWYLDATYTEPVSITVYPQTNTTYYARWINEGCFEQNFEAWPYAENSGGMTRPFTLYTATDKNDPNVYSGKHSIKYDNNDGGTYAISLFDSTMGKLKRNEKYYVTVHYKPVRSAAGKYASSGSYTSIYYVTQATNAWTWTSQGPTLQYYGWCFDSTAGNDIQNYYTCTSNAVTTTTVKDANGWLTATYEITATTDYIALYFAGDFCMYMDDVTITPLPTGLVSEDYANPYCEKFYNSLKNVDFSASAAGKKTIYKLELGTRSDYVFSAQPKNGAKAYLAYDEQGTDPVNGTLFAEDGKLSSSRVMTGFDGVFYLVLEGSRSDFDYLAFFERAVGLEEDPTPAQTRPKANYETLPVANAGTSQAVTESENTQAGNTGTAGTENTANTDTENASPQTGDTALPLLAVLVSVLAAGAMIFVKGGRKA